MSRANTYRLVALVTTLAMAGGLSVAGSGVVAVSTPHGSSSTAASFLASEGVKQVNGRASKWRPRRVDLSRPEVRRAIPGAARLGARRLRRLRNQVARKVG